MCPILENQYQMSGSNNMFLSFAKISRRREQVFKDSLTREQITKKWDGRSTCYNFTSEMWKCQSSAGVGCALCSKKIETGNKVWCQQMKIFRSQKDWKGNQVRCQQVTKSAPTRICCTSSQMDKTLNLLENHPLCIIHCVHTCKKRVTAVTCHRQFLGFSAKFRDF